MGHDMICARRGVGVILLVWILHHPQVPLLECSTPSEEGPKQDAPHENPPPDQARGTSLARAGYS